MSDLYLRFGAILFFTVVVLGFGHSVLWLSRAKRPEHIGLAMLEIAAVGFATFSFLGVVLDLLHIPLHFLVYLGLALVCPIISLVTRNERREPRATWRWKSTETWAFIILVAVVAAYFMLFLRGANAYPYLEDDDPWQHAESVMYVGRTMDASVTPAAPEELGWAFYLEPYPPTYDIMMGVLWQLTRDLVWTLKFFNVLMIAIGLAFSYLLAREYLGSPLKGLFAAVVLAVLPSFMSHFIWSQTLALAVYPIALYATLRALDEKSWRIPAIVSVGSMMVTQPVVSAMFGIMMLLMATLVFLHEAFAKPTGKGTRGIVRFPKTVAIVLVGAGGLLLSMLFWVIQAIKWGLRDVIYGHGGGFAVWQNPYTLLAYSLKEVIFPLHNNRIDQATGWGLGVFLLVIVGLVLFVVLLKRTLNLRKGWMHWHLLLWFLFANYLVFSVSLGMPSYSPSRMWAYAAIPIALLAAESAYILSSSIARKSALLKLALLTGLAILVVATSLPAKAAVQTAVWPPGVQWAAPQQEIAGYLQAAKTLPRNTRVFPMCGTYARSIGFGLQNDPWDLEEQRFKRTALNQTANDTIAFLQAHGYEYFAVDYTCARDDQNATNDFLNRMTASGRVQQVVSTQGYLLLRVG